MIDPEDRQAAYTIAAGMLICVGIIFALYLLGFEFNVAGKVGFGS